MPMADKRIKVKSCDACRKIVLPDGDNTYHGYTGGKVWVVDEHHGNYIPSWFACSTECIPDAIRVRFEFAWNGIDPNTQ